MAKSVRQAGDCRGCRCTPVPVCSPAAPSCQAALSPFAFTPTHRRLLLPDLSCLPGWPHACDVAARHSVLLTPAAVRAPDVWEGCNCEVSGEEVWAACVAYRNIQGWLGERCEAPQEDV